MSNSSQASRRISGAGLPEGQVVASFTRYADAQRAVDHLSDQEHDVSTLSIVGHDLATLEKVTGRLTYPRVALMAAGQGAFFGLFFGLILTMFGGGGISAILLTMLLGAAFWMLLGVITFAAQRGRRDFTSLSTIVATRYDVISRDDLAAQARQTLAQAGLQGRAAGAAPAAVQPAVGQPTGGSQTVPGAQAVQPGGQSAPVDPSAPAGQQGQPGQSAEAGQQGQPARPVSQPEKLPDGRPMYGVRIPQGEAPAEQDGQPQHSEQQAQQPRDDRS